MTRTVLLLQAENSNIEVARPLAERGWRTRREADVTAVVNGHAHDSCGIGIVVFEAPTTFTVPELNRLAADASTDWIAVVPPHMTRDPIFAPLIANDFYDFHTLPLDLDRLLVVLGHGVGRIHLRRRLALDPSATTSDYGMVGASPAMVALRKAIEKFVRVEAPVLITGESGTGKELAAQAVHVNSARRDAPFVAVNCGALPIGLVQAELFGHEKGAFTGAHHRKVGHLEAANGGTIFLDEVADLPLESQASLLRFLQERTIVRVGATRTTPLDVRVIAATNIDLAEAVKQNRFREDLYYRLNVLRLRMPPLRDRTGDVRLLADAVFARFAAQRSPNVRGFSSHARAAMDEHNWPGNVRELINRVQQAMIMCETRLITPRDLQLEHSDPGWRTESLVQARHTVEREAVLNALRRNQHNVAATARELGVSRVTLYRLMQRLAVDRTHTHVEATPDSILVDDGWRTT